MSEPAASYVVIRYDSSNKPVMPPEAVFDSLESLEDWMGWQPFPEFLHIFECVLRPAQSVSEVYL